jgi:hypothetical protein
VDNFFLESQTEILVTLVTLDKCLVSRVTLELLIRVIRVSRRFPEATKHALPGFGDSGSVHFQDTPYVRTSYALPRRYARYVATCAANPPFFTQVRADSQVARIRREYCYACAHARACPRLSSCVTRVRESDDARSVGKLLITDGETGLAARFRDGADKPSSSTAPCCFFLSASSTVASAKSPDQTGRYQFARRRAPRCETNLSVEFLPLNF